VQSHLGSEKTSSTLFCAGWFYAGSYNNKTRAVLFGICFMGSI
jgi:hypothetical protein